MAHGHASGGRIRRSHSSFGRRAAAQVLRRPEDRADAGGLRRQRSLARASIGWRSRRGEAMRNRSLTARLCVGRIGDSALARQCSADWNHRFRALVDGLDDLRAVDCAQISGCDREIGVPELSLDHDQREPLAGHLDGVRVPQLVLVPTSAQASICRPLVYAHTSDSRLYGGDFGVVRSA
jgi:hypothetical protein